MSEFFPELVVRAAVAHPATGVPLLLEAFRSGRLAPSELTPDGGSVLDALAQAAWASRNEGSDRLSPLFQTLFLDMLPGQWRKVCGTDHGLGAITGSFDGLPLGRALLQFWAQRRSVTSKMKDRIDAWLSDLDLELALEPIADEPAGALLEQCLTLGFDRCADLVWRHGGPLGLGQAGRPAIAAVRSIAHWKRFLAERHNAWAPVGPQRKPLIALVLEQQPHNDFRRSLASQAWSELSERPDAPPEARGWASGELKRTIRSGAAIGLSQGLAMLRAVGPANYVRTEAWNQLAVNVGAGWFEALLADAATREALGAPAITQAYYARTFDELHRDGNASLEDLESWLTRFPPGRCPDASGWVCRVPFPALNEGRARHLARLMGPHAAVWWGPDREATERRLFDALPEMLSKFPVDIRRSRLLAFLALTAEADAGPWLRAARVFAQALAVPRGKRQLDLGALANDGPSLLAQRGTSNALDRISQALDVPNRQALAAARRGWALDQSLPPPETRSSARLRM